MGSKERELVKDLLGRSIENFKIVELAEPLRFVFRNRDLERNVRVPLNGHRFALGIAFFSLFGPLFHAGADCGR